MFNRVSDELKEARYFRFQGSHNVKYFKEIKLLKSLQVKAEAYLESKRASTMELSCEYT